ncbi:unnamed protein product [Caenorhabditis angaria]|uniref:THAP-type domain-containing protein n=1 Tax=Caenorhabditis angaria TaxID=860376 RepID=A0A9P1MUV0_9PELO|nr:unnamed protein product [Caenorhabditis angaria]
MSTTNVRFMTCRYCGKTRDQKLLTVCPENKTMLNKWIRILGKKFGENVKNKLNNRICRSHFENLNGPRKPNHLPVREEEEDQEDQRRNDNVARVHYVPAPVRQVVPQNPGGLLQREIKIENMEGFDRNRGQMAARQRDDQNLLNFQCRVCEVYTNEEKLMTLVPREMRELYKWFDILGMDFAENVVKNQEPHYICMCHLKDMIFLQIINFQISTIFTQEAFHLLMQNPMIAHISMRHTEAYKIRAENPENDEFHVEKMLENVPKALANLFSDDFERSFENLEQYLGTLNLKICEENLKTFHQNQTLGLYNYIKFENSKYLKNPKKSESTVSKITFHFENEKMYTNDAIKFFVNVELTHKMGWKITKKIFVEVRRSVDVKSARYLVTHISFDGDCYDLESFESSNSSLVNIWRGNGEAETGIENAEKFIAGFSDVILERETYQEFSYFTDDFEIIYQVGGNVKIQERESALEFLKTFAEKISKSQNQTFFIITQNLDHTVFRISFNSNPENLKWSFHVEIVKQISTWKTSRIILNHPIFGYNHFFEIDQNSTMKFANEISQLQWDTMKSVKKFEIIEICEKQVVFDEKNPEIYDFFRRFAGLVGGENQLNSFKISNFKLKKNDEFDFTVIYSYGKISIEVHYKERFNYKLGIFQHKSITLYCPLD